MIRSQWLLRLGLAGMVVLAASLTVFAAPVAVPAGAPFLGHDIRPGAGVTQVRWLSSYFPGLAGTPGDTLVYVLEGKEPGGTVFVAGGTHGNEIAGIMAATVLVERAKVTKGRLIVIPHANNSAISYTESGRVPAWITVETPNGPRRFKYGSRRTAPEHQGEPDPAKYRHPASTEELDGNEARNLDRSYPGKADGNLTERIAYGILSLIKQEGADIAFDFHESGPESRLAWMIVANPKNLDNGAIALLNLEEKGIPMKLEPSSESFRGLSHREWGDATKAQAFLFETPNPSQVDDPQGTDPANDPQFPLWKRVGVHLETFLEIVSVCNDGNPPAAQVQITGLPSLADLESKGLGAFLN
ncbi:MAG: succinylglutamate desuccinylase/aspartoacylase family protein [Chitinophagales bacterium]